MKWPFQGKDKNPINDDERDRKAEGVMRVEPDLESDKFSPDEQLKIVEMVLDDITIGEEAMAEWKVQKLQDLRHLNSEKPSIIEGSNKEAWQSDRNIGLAAGINDIYQATLGATCWNPEKMSFKATKENDIDNRDNATKFMKWVVGPAEANFDPEVDDFINNRVGLGFSCFKIIWEVRYEWVDKRMPIFDKADDRKLLRYDIETEYRRCERGYIKNIDQLDDILIPDYGKDIQKLSFFIEILHITQSDLDDLADRKIIVNYKDGVFSGLPKTDRGDKLKSVDAQGLGSNEMTPQSGDAEKRNKPIDIHEAYCFFTKGNRREKYRFWIEKSTRTFLSGKPLRKINRSGKIPYAGGPLRRRPGFLRGGSLTQLIAPVINFINNAINQISDFQYFQNCPDGYFDKNQDTLAPGIQDVFPGKLTPVDGDPNKLVFFPNRTRSMAWGYQFIQFLMETLERLTGAASYFLTSNQPDTTATRDNIVEEKGQVKFGLWVRRIQIDIAEALNQLFQLYQENAPPDLATRVIGEDGKAIIKNLSINSLRGNMDLILSPDVTSGSKAYEKQVSLFAVQAASSGCIWLDPRINPRGNWILWKEALRAQGMSNPERILPPQPKDQMDYSKQAEEHFNEIKQGETPEPPGPDSPDIVPCLATFIRYKETEYHEVDEEYRPIFDNYLFKAYHNYQKFIQKIQQEQMAMQIASQAAQSLERMGMGQPGAGRQPRQPNAQGMAPGAAPMGNQAPVGAGNNGFGAGE